MLKNGFYLSAYLSINKIGYISEYVYRHNQNLALWNYNNGYVYLVNYWEIENMTGIKDHYKSFYSRDEAIILINHCLAECNITLSDVNEIWGTPDLDNNFMHFWNINRDIADHALSHMYAGLLADTENFRNSTMISMVFDQDPDRDIDKNAFNKKYYAGCLSSSGMINEIFSIHSPGLLWIYVRKQTGKEIEFLQRLAESCQADYIIDKIPLVLIDNHKSMERAYDQLDILFEQIRGLCIDNIGVSFDARFTEEENKISIYVKMINRMSLAAIDYELDKTIKRFGINVKECILVISGNYVLNNAFCEYLSRKYLFKGLQLIPYLSDRVLSLGIGLRAFYLQSNNQFTHRFKDFRNWDNSYFGYQNDRSNVECQELFLADRIEKRTNEINPFGMSHKEIGYLYLFEYLKEKYDLTIHTDVEELRGLINKLEKKNAIDMERFVMF